MANKLNFVTGVAALALVFGAGSAFAQYDPQPHQTEKSNPGVYNSDHSNAKSPADDAFAQKAAQADMAEVKLGQLAEQKSSNPEVKAFGKRMIDDHSKNESQLQATASSENLTLPNHIDQADQETYDRLSKLSGSAFDRAYARDMVNDHTKDLAEFQKEAKDAQNEAIKNYAAETVPVLQTHLDLARKMDSAVNQSANNTRTGTTYPSNNTVPATER